MLQTLVNISNFYAHHQQYGDAVWVSTVWKLQIASTDW